MFHPAKDLQIDLDQLELAVKANAVRKFKHPTLDLFGYDYTDACTHERMWKEFPIASICRGLVLDSKGNIVAMPFPKFFNFGEADCEITYEQVKNITTFTCFNKIDGSLGILFNYCDQWHVMTRGSFASDQANKAREWLANGASVNVNELNKSCTYLAEIVYPQNRVVVDYGDYTGFVFLGAYDNITFKDLTNDLLGNFPAFSRHTEKFIKNITWKDLTDEIKSLPLTEEGRVLLFDNGRCKLKADEYCRVHKLKSNITPIAIWETMLTYKADVLHSNIVPKDMLKDLPEEFEADYKSLWNAILNKYYNNLETISNDIVNFAIDVKTNNLESQKDKAIFITKNYKENAAYIFLSIRHNTTDIKTILTKENKALETVMRNIRPDGNAL